MAIIICLSILTIYILSVPNNIFSATSVVINELYANPVGGTNEEKVGEWVELFNTSNNEIDLSGWSLCDEANHMIVISSDYTNGGTTILPGQWLLIKRNNSTFSLNNGKEKVSLFDKNNCEGNSIDSVEYENAVENESIGRIPDGIGQFRHGLHLTPESKNSTPDPSPNTNKKVVVSNNNELNETTIPSPSPTKTSSITVQSQEKVLGENKKITPKLLNKSPLPSQSPIKNQEHVPSSDTESAYIFTGLGLIFLGISVAFAIWYYRMKRKVDLPNKLSNKNKDQS